jgi:hypothetical protein
MDIEQVQVLFKAQIDQGAINHSAFFYLVESDMGSELVRHQGSLEDLVVKISGLELLDGSGPVPKFVNRNPGI